MCSTLAYFIRLLRSSNPHTNYCGFPSILFTSSYNHIVNTFRQYCEAHCHAHWRTSKLQHIHQRFVLPVFDVTPNERICSISFLGLHLPSFSYFILTSAFQFSLRDVIYSASTSSGTASLLLLRNLSPRIACPFIIFEDPGFQAKLQAGLHFLFHVKLLHVNGLHCSLTFHMASL